ITTTLENKLKLKPLNKNQLQETIHEKPTAKEKNDCPNAYNNDSAVKLEKSGLRKNSTPSIAPSNVKERITNIIKNINNNGIIYLFARSIPFFIPSAMTNTFITVNIAKPISVTLGLPVTCPNKAP